LVRKRSTVFESGKYISRVWQENNQKIWWRR